MLDAFVKHGVQTFFHRCKTVCEACMLLPKRSGVDWKVHVPSVLPYRGTFGTGGTCIFGSLSFLQKRSLQKLNADKTSGELSAADIDLIGVFKVITALILFEEGTKALL